MYALVVLEKMKATIVLTDINNIDWEDKSIIDNTEIEENEYLLEDIISVYDTVEKTHTKVKVNELSTDIHQIIINKKLYVPLHVLR